MQNQINMDIKDYFEQRKGLTVDSAFRNGARYTAIDICKFAKDYHEQAMKNVVLDDSPSQSTKLHDFISSMQKIKPNWSCQQMIDYITEFEKSK